MALVDDVRTTLAWIDSEHRLAREECERLLELNRSRPAAAGPEGVRESMRIAVDVAAATARLETWNEIKGELVKQVQLLSPTPAGPSR
jgi:hypothetical protein